MHLRLEELFGGGEWLGSRNMLFVSDLVQLQPVSGSPVFEKIATHCYSNLGVQLLLTFGTILLFMTNSPLTLRVRASQNCDAHVLPRSAEVAIMRRAS